MLAPSRGGLILYQAYGRKAHLLEDKQIPSVGVFDEVFSTWMTFGGNTCDLDSFGEKTYKITDLHQIHVEVLFTERGDGVTCIKRRRRDLSSDGVRDLATVSGRGRLKEDLELSTPVVKMFTLRCMLNVLLCNNWDLFQLDINNTFLYGDLSKDVYMTLPPGFDNEKSKVLYADDIVITNIDLSKIEKFKLFLKSKYQINVLDNKDGLLAAKHVDTSLPENTTLNHTESEDDHLLDNIRSYQRRMGKLIYLTNTRLDISYVVHCLSQFMHAPLVSHLDAALRVLRYLKGSLRSGIQINKNGYIKLRAFADSDWIRCLATRKSVSGYCVFLGDSLCMEK
ncbi:ribonuclease H-like domain-containing protein [Tanacetum coccineum]